MLDTARRVETVSGRTAADLDLSALLAARQPILFKGMAAEWPLVRLGREGPGPAMDYLKSFYRGQPVVGYTGAPEIGGRYFYDDSLTGLNFRAERVMLDTYLDRMREHLGDPQTSSFYVGSTDVDGHLPGLRADNDLGLEPAAFGAEPPLVSIWIGNRTVAATHYDMSNNIACSLVGRRRFTLFPPEQIHNLYPGPLEPTPGGQVVSMVDLHAPDLERYPRFAEVMAEAQVAEMEPGDVLFYPALWWHQVNALEPFNVMVNYWWNGAPRFMDTPMNTLLHGLLSLRDRPDAEKQAWRAMFDYYLFGPADRAGAHLPEAVRGPLAPMDELGSRRLRAHLLNRLNR